MYKELIIIIVITITPLIILLWFFKKIVIDDLIKKYVQETGKKFTWKRWIKYKLKRQDIRR